MLHVGSLTPREFDRRRAPAAAVRRRARSARAIERSRLYEQRRVAEVLQRRLLPAESRQKHDFAHSSRQLAICPRGRRAAWAATGTTCSRSPAGASTLAVGDAVGRGVEAAAVMAQWHAVRAYAADGHPSGRRGGPGQQPDAALGRGHDDPGPAWSSTRRAETLEIVSAGHLPRAPRRPLRRGAVLWRAARGRRSARCTTSIYTAEPARSRRHIVLAYTDGLIERRPRSTDAGLEPLRSPGGGRRRTPRRLCGRSSSTSSPRPRRRRRLHRRTVPPLGDHLATRWDASPGSLAPIRYLLRRWLLGARRHGRRRRSTSSSPRRRRARTRSTRLRPSA